MIKALLKLKEEPRSLSSLARELGTNRKRLKEYLKFLEEEGYVERIGGVYMIKKVPSFLSTR
ncbi:DNA-binding protein [Ignicoccus pacificus DSM 13166]|uniref:DNA-binding protein n=1 Tax=Ignicoccus pacificus DSM 13166 TaxID=940294 RepID=A0A977PKR4_9CREN|nr:DNA-binding protein [Ignicoccus pacificus DSM 13166]